MYQVLVLLTSSGIISIVISSLTPSPWLEVVSTRATLWLTINGSKLSLKEVKVIILDPDVLKRLEDCKK